METNWRAFRKDFGSLKGEIEVLFKNIDLYLIIGQDDNRYQSLKKTIQKSIKDKKRKFDYLSHLICDLRTELTKQF